MSTLYIFHKDRSSVYQNGAIFKGDILKKWLVVMTSTLLFSTSMAISADSELSTRTDVKNLVWEPGTEIESFWLKYTNLKGGLTWGSTSQYPDYDKVKEGDTLLIQLDQGPCLMEFFHSRWRRANDVRRWGEPINAYGGCPHVFD